MAILIHLNVDLSYIRTIRLGRFAVEKLLCSDRIVLFIDCSSCLVPQCLATKKKKNNIFLVLLSCANKCVEGLVH